MTSGSDVLTSAKRLTVDCVGRRAYVRGAGTAGAVLSATITGYLSGYSVRLSVNAATTVTDTDWVYGTDDTAVLQAAFSSGRAITDEGRAYLTGPLVWPTRLRFVGAGPGNSEFVALPGSTAPAISTTDPTAELLYCTGFAVDGLKSFQTSSAAGGVSVVGTTDQAAQYAASRVRCVDPGHRMSDIFVHHTKGAGWTTGGRGGCQTNNLRIFDCDGHGLVVENFDSFWSDIEIGGTGLDGVWVKSGGANSRFNNLKVFYSGNIDRTTYGAGLRLDASGCQFGPTEIQNAGADGVVLFEAERNIFSALYVEFPGATIGALAAVVADGIVLRDSSRNQITCTVWDRYTPAKLDRAVVLDRTSYGCAGNRIRGFAENYITAAYALDGTQTLGTNSIDLTAA
jgi:hypothetical protein